MSHSAQTVIIAALRIPCVTDRSALLLLPVGKHDSHHHVCTNHLSADMVGHKLKHWRDYSAVNVEEGSVHSTALLKGLPLVVVVWRYVFVWCVRTYLHPVSRACMWIVL